MVQRPAKPPKTRPVDHDPFGPQLVSVPRTRAARDQLIKTMRDMAQQAPDATTRGALDQMEMAMFSAYPHKFIAMHNGLPVGAIAFGSPDGKESEHVEIHHLGSIHSGVGRMLVEQAMARAAKEDKLVRLHSTKEAMSFYSGLGFTPVKHDADPHLEFDPNAMGPGQKWEPSR